MKIQFSPESLQVSSLEVSIEFLSKREVCSEELHTTTREELVTSLYNNLASTGPGYTVILYVLLYVLLAYYYRIIYHLSLALTDKS